MERGVVFCANCGTRNDDSARFCVKCGSAIGGAPPRPSPPPAAPVPPPPAPSPPPAWGGPAAPAWPATSYPPPVALPPYGPSGAYLHAVAPAPPQAYGAAPAPPFSMAGASPGMMNIVGFVFIVLAGIASLVATGLSSDEAYEWAAGIYLLSAVLFIIAGLFFFMARRAAATRGPAPGPYPPR